MKATELLALFENMHADNIRIKDCSIDYGIQYVLAAEIIRPNGNRYRTGVRCLSAKPDKEVILKNVLAKSLKRKIKRWIRTIQLSQK